MSQSIFLLVLPLALFFCLPTRAQEEESEDEELEEEFELLEDTANVVFSAAKHEQKIGFSPNAVVVITRKDIEDSGATTITDLLRRWPVTRVYEFDPMFPTVEVRFMYRVLLLIDGREMNHEIAVSPLFAILPINLLEIERIEIVLGPSSAIYGANAVSAVINIITRRPSTEPQAEAHLWVGEHGGLEADWRAAAGAGPLAFKFHGGFSRADLWMLPGEIGKEVYRGGGRAELWLGPARLDLDAGFSHSRGMLFSIIGYLKDKGTWIGHADASLRYGDLFLHAFWYGSRPHLDPVVELYYPDLGISLGRIKETLIQSDILQGEAQWNAEPWAGNQLILGADTRFTRSHAKEFVEDTATEVRAGAFFHNEQKLGEKWLLQAGLRYDWNSRTDWALSPRGAVIFNPAAGHYLRLSGGMAFRKPSMMETTMNFEVEANPAFPEVKDLFEKYGLSNPDLVNELLGSVELGWRSDWLEGRLKTSIEGYASFNRHVIGFRTDVVFEQTPLGPRLNLEKSQIGFEDLDDDLDVYGAHVSLEGRPWKWLEVFLRAELRHALFAERGYTVCRWYPRYIVALGATFRLEWGLHGQAVWAAVGGSRDLLRNPESALAPSTEVSLPAYQYLIFFLGRSFQAGPVDLELGVNFFDVFNHHFREKIGVVKTDGTNFGGEILGRRLMALLSVVY